MEAQEKEKGEEKNGVSVEAKIFLCIPTNIGMILQEKHNSWKREISLSLEELRWISGALKNRKLQFGYCSRKESRKFGRNTISLIEGGNQYGCFLAIQTRSGKTSPAYIIVPSGRKGFQWGRCAQYLDAVLEGTLNLDSRLSPGRGLQEGTPRATSSMNWNGGNHLKTRQTGQSYAQIVANQHSYGNREWRRPATFSNPIASEEGMGSFELRLIAMEKEVAQLSTKLCNMTAALGNPISETGKMTSDHPIESIQTDVICSKQTSDISVCDLPALNSTVTSILNAKLRQLFDTEPEMSSLNQVFDDPISMRKLVHVCSHTVSEYIENLGSEGTPSDGVSADGNEVEDNDSDTITPSKPAIDDVGGSTKDGDSNDDALGNIDNEIKEGGNVVSSPLFEWDAGEDALIHVATGMRYSLEGKGYYSWVSNDNDDLRMIYYEFVGGRPTLMREGRLAWLNSSLMQDIDWDRGAIITEEYKGYHPDMEAQFLEAIERRNINI